MMTESQALETLTREDPEAAGDAKAALAWLTGDEGLETISLLRLQEFLWYALPVKWPMSTPGRVGVAKALGRLFALAGLDRYAGVCSSTGTEKIITAYADGHEEGIAAHIFHHVQDETVVPLGFWAGHRYIRPDITKHVINMLIAAGILLIVVAFALLVQVPDSGNANPANSTFIPRPAWYFLAPFQLLKYMPGPLEALATAVLPIVAGSALFLLPFIDRRRGRHGQRSAQFRGWKGREHRRRHNAHLSGASAFGIHVRDTVRPPADRPLVLE